MVFCVFSGYINCRTVLDRTGPYWSNPAIQYASVAQHPFCFRVDDSIPHVVILTGRDRCFIDIQKEP